MEALKLYLKRPRRLCSIQATLLVTRVCFVASSATALYVDKVGFYDLAQEFSNFELELPDKHHGLFFDAVKTR